MNQTNPEIPTPQVSIDCPSALIAATAPALGYVPIGEIVLWWTDPRSSRGYTLAALALADLRSSHLAKLVADVLAVGARRAHVVAWVDVPDGCPLPQLPTTGQIDELLWIASQAGLELEPAITTNGRWWWSHVCPGGFGCCPEGGGPVDESRALAVTAEFIGCGLAVLPSRTALQRSLEPDPVQAAQVASLLPEAPPPTLLEAWRSTEIDWLSGWWTQEMREDSGTAAGAVPAQILARILAALADVRVRDTVMWRLGLWGPLPMADPQRLRPVLATLVRAADPERLPAPSTLLAITAWLAGDGALAGVAVDRALAANADYNLGRLTKLMIDGVLEPSAWRDGLRDLTEGECRTGQQEPGNRGRRAQRVVHLVHPAGRAGLRRIAG